MPGKVDLVALLGLSVEPRHAEAQEGMSLAEMLFGELAPGSGLRVYVGERFVAENCYASVYPLAGSTVTVRGLPLDSGGGGGGGKDTLRTLLTIAVIAGSIAAPFALPFIGLASTTTIGLGLTLGQAVSTLIGTAGLLAVNALVPPSKPVLAEASGQDLAASPSYSLTGASNDIALWGVIPQVLGRHRVVPPFGVRPFTEINGDEQFLRVMTIWSYGRCKVGDLFVGETKLSNLNEVDQQTREGVAGESSTSIIPTAVFENPLNLPLTQEVGWVQRTTEPDADEATLDFSFPIGLFKQGEEGGERRSAEVQIKIEYRRVGDSGGWSGAPDLNIRESKPSSFSRPARVKFPSRNQYDVRTKRLTTDSTDIDDEVYSWLSTWSVLRTITNENPIQFEKRLARSEIRLLASEQINGSIDAINAVCEIYGRTWNSGTQTWSSGLSTTRNNASLALLVLQGDANPRPQPDSKIDLPAWGHFYEHCVANSFEFNQVRDFEGSVWDALTEICAAGRAAPTILDGKFSVIIDEPKSVPAQHFSTRNSWGFEGNKVFPDPPHAWRVRFVNELKNYRQDERIVYDDGYSKLNATKFEMLELPGVTHPDQIYKLARYHIAVARLRPEVYALNCDFENLVCTRGDLVRVSHDVPSWGIARGRVKARTGTTTITAVTVDEPCPIETGGSYSIRFRKSSGASVLANVSSVSGDGLTITFPGIAAAGAPNVGDWFAFGEVNNESVLCLVKQIEPLDDMAARLTLVDYGPEVFNAHTGTIPAFDSHITIPPELVLKPTTPSLREIQSDLSVAVRQSDGSIQERVVITADAPSGPALGNVMLEAQFKRDKEDTWSRSVTQGDPTRVIIGDVIGGELYDFRIRRVGAPSSAAPGAKSDWFVINDYTVLGKTDLPPDIDQLLLEGTRAVWTYDPPLDFKGFQLRFHRGAATTWSDATPVHEGYVSETQFDLTHLRAGAFNLLVKAIDSGLRESANAALLAVDIGDPLVENLILDDDFHGANGFYLGTRGTVTGGSLLSGALRANDLSQFWSGIGSTVFWSGVPASTFWGSTYAEMAFLARYTPAAGDVGTTAKLNMVTAGSIKSLDYRIGAGDFRAWPGSVTVQSTEQIEWRLVLEGGSDQGIISEFSVQVDVPDISETLSDVAILAAGTTRLPITLDYRAIKNVQLTIQDPAGSSTAYRIVVVDKNPTLGPLVKAYSAAGALVAATVDATIQGY